jgi:hypothetical protein
VKRTLTRMKPHGESLQVPFCSEVRYRSVAAGATAFSVGGAGLATSGSAGETAFVLSPGGRTPFQAARRR